MVVVNDVWYLWKIKKKLLDSNVVAYLKSMEGIMKKSLMIAAIWVVVISMFIGCALSIGIPGDTGESGETSGHISESSTVDLAQDIRRMLVVPDDVKKVVDAAMDLFVDEDQWVNSFTLQLEDEWVERLWYIHFNIKTSKEPSDEQFRQVAEILSELGYPQEDIHLNLSDQEKKPELLLSSERMDSIEYVYVDYRPESLEIHILLLFDPPDGEVGLDLDKGDNYNWSCTNDVANMLGINIKNLLENLSYTASYEEEGYNDIDLLITNFKDQEAPVFRLFAEGYLAQSGIENVVDKVEMIGDTYGRVYLMDDGGSEGVSATLEDARCDNSSFNVYFTVLPSSKFDSEIREVKLRTEIVVK